MSNTFIPLSERAGMIFLTLLKTQIKFCEHHNLKPDKFLRILHELEKALENPIDLDEWAVVPKKGDNKILREIIGLSLIMPCRKDPIHHQVWEALLRQFPTHPALKHVAAQSGATDSLNCHANKQGGSDE